MEKVYGNSVLGFNYSFGKPNIYVSGLLNIESGDMTSYTGETKSIKDDMFLIQNLYSYPYQSKEDTLSSFKQSGFFILYPNNKDILSKNFLTPPRTGCGNYLPESFENIDFVPGHAQTYKEEEIEHYRENIMRGEYIYSHRADHCGKFTYRFHWTDLKNPGPVILEGWQ